MLAASATLPYIISISLSQFSYRLLNTELELYRLLIEGCHAGKLEASDSQLTVILTSTWF